MVNAGNVSGVTSSSLTINPAQISDASADYYVVAYGACLPNDTSAMAALFVNTIPVAYATSNSPVCVGASIELMTQNESGASYLWTGPSGYFSTAQNPVIASAEMANAGTYTLVVSVTGCSSFTSTTAVVVNHCAVIVFHIPEGFSPNNDQINDLFIIRGIENYPGNNIMIYNRWGNQVFEAAPYQNTWDGRSDHNVTVGGDELPTGTYFYILNLGDGSDVYKGTIYLNGLR